MRSQRGWLAGAATVLALTAVGCSASPRDVPEEGPNSSFPATAWSQYSALEQLFPVADADDVTTGSWPADGSLELERCEYEGRGRWYLYGSIANVAPGTALGLDLELSSGDVGSGYRTAATVVHPGEFRLLFDAGDGTSWTDEQLEEYGRNNVCQIVVRGTAGRLASSNVAMTLTGYSTVLTTLPARYGSASLSPSKLRPGSSFTLSPSVPVLRRCDRAAELLSVNGGYVLASHVLGETNIRAEPGATIPPGGECAPVYDATPAELTLPVDITAGTYLICMSPAREEAGCATAQVS